MAPQVIDPIRAIYDEADISLHEDLNLPPDHLGLELAYLSHLLGECIEGDLAERPQYQKLAQRLIGEHLRPFLVLVLEQLPRVSAHPYYQAAAELAAALLSEAEKSLAEF